MKKKRKKEERNRGSDKRDVIFSRGHLNSHFVVAIFLKPAYR